MSKKRSARLSLILGALLHDIGKFEQRAKDNPKRPEYNHQHWGVEWFQKEQGLAEKLTAKFDEDEKQNIRSAISNHHHAKEYISLADAISAGMDRIDIDLENEETGDPYTDRLITIFSRVSISNKSKSEMYQQFAGLGKNELQEIFPLKESKITQREYTELLNAFNQEIEKVDFSELSPSQAVEKIYFLLWKYTWCIPSAVYKNEPDVSLFDHLKTTAAIAGCLYDYHQENSIRLDVESPAFRLVGGDISGIQSYIFDVLTQQGKVAKRLRARSFFVQLISEIAAHRILHSFDLPLLNILSSAGGNFYILIPNLKDSEKKIGELQKKFDSWTLEKLHGELSVSLASVPVSGRDLLDFTKTSEKVKRGLSICKYQPHKLALSSDSKWGTANFIRPEVIQGDEKACEGCHHYPLVDEEERLCYRCARDIKTGKLLTKNKYIAFYRNGNGDRYEVLDYSFKLCNQEDLKNNDIKEAYLVIGLNDTHMESTVTGFKYITTHIPIDEEKTPLNFNEIAEKSEGDKLLGYVKVDVDDMGKIFAEGFDPENPKGKFKIPGIKPSISRFCSLSRMLETFFGGYLQKRLEKDFSDIYTVFSGGDDFFVVGPWDRAIKFVKEIREQLKTFTGENPDFTLSAGIVLAKPHEPISFCADKVNEELERSKQPDLGKDKITLFNQTVGWKELNNILDQANKVIRWSEEEPPLVSRGFINNLRKYGEMSRKYDETKRTEWLRFIPLLVSDIKRNLDENKQKEPYDWVVNLLPTISKPSEEDYLPYLRLIMEYVLTYTRRGESEEKM